MALSLEHFYFDFEQFQIQTTKDYAVLVDLDLESTFLVFIISA